MRIVIANIKDKYVDSGGRDILLFLEVLNGMVKCGRMLAISCKRSRKVGLIGCSAPLSRLRCSFGSCGGVSGFEGASVG